VVGVARYALGVSSLAVICVSLGVAAVALRRRYAPADWDGALARLAEVVIAWALLTAELEVLGTLRLFRLAPIVAASVLVGLGTFWGVARGRAGGTRAAHVSGGALRERGAALRDRGAATGGVAVAGTALAALAVIVVWGGRTFISYDFGIRSFDSLWYHLPWAASYAQTGQITGLRFTDVEYLTAFYPATAETFHGAGIVLLGRDTLSPIFNLVWLGLTLLAAWCLGRPRGLGPLTMAGAALALAVPMLSVSQAGTAANDIVGVFFLLATAAFLVNSATAASTATPATATPLAAPPAPPAPPPATESSPPLLKRAFGLTLGGVAAGLAIAVKLSLVIPALALTVGVVVLIRRRWLLWVGPMVLAGAFWYVRNLIAVGNPLPWLNIPGLATPTQPLQADTGFSVLHYLFDGHAWSKYFQPGFAAGLGPWWWAIVAMVLLGPLLCVGPGADRALRVLAVAALGATVGYLITPESAAGPAGQPLGFAFNLRYSAPALVFSLAVLPLAPALGSRPARLAVLALLASVLIATVAQARWWPARQLPAAFALAGAVVVIAVIAVRSAPAALAAAAVIVVVAGYPLQRHYLHARYVFHPRVSQLAATWDLFRNIHHERVGLVGTFGGFVSYPYYGLDVSNRVQYVGQHGPHGSFTPIASCPAWRAAVNAGRFRYLIATPARDPWHPRPLMRSPEAAWTRSDPAAHVIYQRRGPGPPITAFALDGPLNPSGCR
jgi:hypothetical protein